MLSEWDFIRLRGRTVVIAFDSDSYSKIGVHKILSRLQGVLKFKHAKVRSLVLPDFKDGSKCGLDDAFVSGISLDDMQVDTLPHKFGHSAIGYRIWEDWVPYPTDFNELGRRQVSVALVPNDLRN